jgi:ATP-dependent DNA helicase DinG
MRSRAAESNLVVVNHHLLCADASVRQSAYGEVIPDCQYAIIDEAHQLEDVATQYFGVSVSSYRCEELVRDGERLAATGVAREQSGELSDALERVRERAHDFFRNVVNGAPARANQSTESRVRLSAAMLEPHYEDAAILMGSLDRLEATAALIKTPAPDPERPRESTKLDLAGLVHRAGELRDELRFVLKASERDYVYFLETRGRGVFLRACPIDVSAILRDLGSTA